MRDFYFLSWFDKSDQFHKSMFHFVRTGTVDMYLKDLYKKKKHLIIKGKELCREQASFYTVYTDQDYPSCFRGLDRPPWVLTYKGNLSLLNESDKVSIVGSRRADPEAVYWLRKNIKQLSKSSVVVSGGAIGIDQEAHKAAYASGLKTVCVLPVGINCVYPHSLKSFINEVFAKEKKSLLLISQFYPDQKVFKSSFYPRNYVLSAVSGKLIVVQSERRSGTMVTAKYALDHGKEIYTLPSTPWDLRYSGNLKLLEDGAHQLIDLNLIHM